MSNPWEIPNSPWKDEKAYFNWLRSSIRRLWTRHPVKVLYKQSRRYKAPVGKGNKEVWVSDCEMCGKQCRDNQVDHLQGGFGFKDWESFCEWSKMILWVTFDDIRELCIECHEVVSLSQSLGLTFDEAKTEKAVIKIMKLKASEIDKFLADNDRTCAKNKDARRAAVREVLKNEHN